MRSYTLIRRLEGHQSSVVSCDFSPDSALLVTASYDTCVIMWDPYTGEQLRTLRYGAGGGKRGYRNGVERCQGGFGGAERGLELRLSVFFPPQPRPPALGAGLQQRRPHQLPAVGLLLPRGPLPGHGGGRQVS